MYSQIQSAKSTSTIVMLVSALLLGLVTQASANDVAASFERMLNPGKSAIQSTSYQAESDPLYTMVNARLWDIQTSHDNSTPIGLANIVESFERMLNPVKTEIQSVAYHAESDPLYTMVNARLWSAPIGLGNIAASFKYMLDPVHTTGRSVVAYRTVHDPLYQQINAMLWNTPANDEAVAVISSQGLLIVASCEAGSCQSGLIN